MLVSSADLVARTRHSAGKAVERIEQATAADDFRGLSIIEGYLTCALSEIRTARWGVERRQPQFDDVDLELLLAHETSAISEGRGLVPPPLS